MNVQTENNGKCTGAVLVIGGGIAGIQASLDLAESGQKVYLLEKSPAIGGNMARLDKTFPTNDCSMCILSPKIVECGRHLNIEVITWADLKSVTGSAGNFTVTICKRARYVDLAICTGCGDCVEVCPVKIGNEFDASLGTRKGIFRPYAQAYPNAFVIDKKGKSPCRAGCPAGININAYVALTAEGRFEEALKTIVETVPFPGTLGRVCDHPCETECHLRNFGEPVSICAIKRFLADRNRTIKKPVNSAEQKEQTLANVAIIGSGPAGLTAGRELARLGYKPVVFEASNRPGGMLTWGIPDYRLPPELLSAEINDILEEGVELKLNTALGPDVTLESLRSQGIDAVVLALGAQAGSALGIEGEALDGVTDSIAFLRKVNSGNTVATGRHVTVIGGGNAAIDSARTSLRLGAETVTVVYRRSRAEMPAIAAEVEAAEQEGIRFHYLAAPVKIRGVDGALAAIECIRMKLGEADASGRFRPEPIPGSEFIIETDMLISAIGQNVVLPQNCGLDNLARTRWGTIETSPDGSTSIEGVFGIGDSVTGPRSVIEAIAEGRKAAHAVDCYLRGVPYEPLPHVGIDDVVKDPPEPDRDHPVIPRQKPPELTIEERLHSFTEVEGTLTEEQVRAEAQRCLHCALCSECMACVEACKANAICHDQQDTVEEVAVGSIIVLPGFEEFMGALQYDYGYSRYADVVSSVQFERILSVSGPYGGHLQRPSDGTEPKKIAFLQCVGSRDTLCRNAYCSSVCCMYAIKEAVIAREHCTDVEVTVFFMDMRAFGKDFEKYYERAKNEYGVSFVRARVSDVSKLNGNSGLSVRYSPESGGVEQEQFDMVVLSVGLEPSADMRTLAGKLGIRLLPNGFIWTEPAHPLHTSRKGVYVGGTASGPKDIPETVVQASGAACEASRLLSSARNTLTVEHEYPPERDVSTEEPRIGVFVCHCGINIGGIVDVPDIAGNAGTLPHVVFAEDNLYTCSQDTQDHIKEKIIEHNLNRVVVASCSPRTHEPLFQQTLREAGLNPYLFEMANIRDQCTWIHMHEREAAREKARALIRMAIAKVTLAEPLQAAMLDVTQSALIIGGGVAGMTAALAIADQHYDVILIEREKKLGGNLLRLKETFAIADIPSYVQRLERQVRSHPHITVYTGCALQSVEGFIGNYESTLLVKKKEISVKHGVIIVATGGTESKPGEYLYGTDPRVVTQLELEEKIESGLLQTVHTIVMIQCVGSREPEHLYCSRVCCNTAVKNAIRIKELNPETEVYILYRDIRTYGFTEERYQEARDKGVLFIRYDLDGKPVVTGNTRLQVTVHDPLVDQLVQLHPDLLVLSSRIEADSGNEILAQLLKIPMNEDRFFLEAHVKLRPVEFATEGIYVAGMAHSPKTLDETIAQAEAAAAKAVTIISKNTYRAEPTIAALNEDLCDGCGICVPVCEYNALEIIDRPGGKEGEIIVRLNEAMCKGCGACVAACPCGAMEQKGFKNEQMLAMIDAALAD